MKTYKIKEYNAEEHDRFRALGLPTDIAEKLTTVECFIDGVPQGECSVVLMKDGTAYRGDVLICAAGISGKEPGYLCGLAELKEVRRIRGIAPNGSVVPPGVNRGDCYAWFFENPRRVVEMPLSVKKDFYTLVIPKDQVTEYPTCLEVGGEEWAKIRRKYGL